MGIFGKSTGVCSFSLVQSRIRRAMTALVVVDSIREEGFGVIMKSYFFTNDSTKTALHDSENEMSAIKSI
jgi:hypothetical protein